MSDDVECTNDTDFGSLWGLNNSSNPNIDISACSAWQITEGNGIDVAVLDQGIELTHLDLQSNISSISYDTESNSSPSQIFGDHGTHVAGTIAAIKNNNRQVVGVAPQATLISVSNSLQGIPNSRLRRADGINWAWQHGAEIISNSWSSSVQYQMIDDAISNALTNGRNGLGTIVVFAAGNDNGSVDYPANSNPDILAVGSITSTGARSIFSNFGNELDVVAPGSGILSTELNNSTGVKNGTSMATPHVSGVAALVLAVDPNLTAQEVRDIIEGTAKKVGGYGYSTTPTRPNGTWDNEMGYGLINAFAAVQAASGATLNGPAIICSPSTETFSLLQGGTNVTWTSSSNVEMVSSSDNNASIKPKYSSSIGDGWLTATLNNNQTITRTFGVNQNFGDDPMSVTYYRYSTYLDVTVHGGSGETPYYWYLNNVFQRTTTLRTTTFYYTASSGRIEVRNDNACGTGQNIAYYTGYFGGGYSYSVYPNPASSEILVQSTSEIPTSATTNNFSNISKKPIGRLYNFQGIFLKEVELNPYGTINLDLSDLIEGYYFLKIPVGKEEEEIHKIIVSH